MTTKVKWTAENDQLLLLKILETSNVSIDANAISAAWPADKGEMPTARAVKERLVKIRTMAKENGASHFVVGKGGAKVEAKEGANPRAPNSNPRKPRAIKEPANDTGLKRGRGRPAAIKKEATSSDDEEEEEEEEVTPSPTKNTGICNGSRKRVHSGAEDTTTTMTTRNKKARKSFSTEDSDTMSSPSKKAKSSGTFVKALTPVHAASEEDDLDEDIVASPTKRAKNNITRKAEGMFAKTTTPIRARSEEEELDEDITASPPKKVERNVTPKGKSRPTKAVTPVGAASEEHELDEDTAKSPNKKGKTVSKSPWKGMPGKAPARTPTPDEEELDEDTIRVAYNGGCDGTADKKAEESGSDWGLDG
ncbi:MAG: hypothetical protein Q9187_006347 [Circinaria calcarea]